MNFSLSSANGRGGGGGGGKRKQTNKAQLVAEARKARAQRAKTLAAQHEAERQLAAARVLQHAARRCGCVRRMHLRRVLRDDLDTDLTVGEPPTAGSLDRLCRRLVLFCDPSLEDDAARLRKLSLLVLKHLSEYCAPAVSDSRWVHHAAQLGSLALQKLGAANVTEANSNCAAFATEIKLLIALTDSAGWQVAQVDTAKAKAASTRVLGALVSTWDLHPMLRILLLRCNCLAAHPLWAQAVLTLAARPVLVLHGAAKLDAVRRLVMFQFTISGLVSDIPNESVKPLRVVLPAVLQWLSVPQLQATVTPTSRLSVVANCIDTALAGTRVVASATLQRLLATTIGLMGSHHPDMELLATEKEAAQLAAAWNPRIVKLLAQDAATNGAAKKLDTTSQEDSCASKPGVAKAELHLPWTLICEVQPPSSTDDPAFITRKDTTLFFSLLYDAVAPLPAMQNEFVSNVCAVSEPSLLAIVWSVLTRGDSKGNLHSLLAAAAARNIGTHSLLRPLQLFLRLGLFAYVVLRDDEILGDREQMPSSPLPLDHLADALNLLNQIAFRCLWDGDGLAYPQIDRDICNRCIKLLNVLYYVDERARIKGKEIMPESRWRIGNSKLSKQFETELVRRSARATTIAAQMPHLPKRSAAQRLAAAERRRAAFSARSDPSRRAEDLRQQALEAIARVEFQTAMQCLCAAIEIDPKNSLAFANRSAVLCSLGENTAALDDARKCIALAEDSPIGYMRLAMAMVRQHHSTACTHLLRQCKVPLCNRIFLRIKCSILQLSQTTIIAMEQTELNDLANAKANFDIASSLAPTDVRLAALAQDAEKRLQLQVAESERRVQRMAEAERKVQDRALAKKAAREKVREDEMQRQELMKTAVANKKAFLESQKAQRHEEHMQRQKADKARRDARRAERDKERAQRSEKRAQEDAQRQRIQKMADEKRKEAEVARKTAEIARAKEEAEQARITSLKWKKTIKERQLLSDEKIRMLAKQRQERRRMEREHASAKQERSRQVAAILASSGTVIPSDFTCPLSGNIMLHPVTASDGYHYERSAIQAWQSKNETSPMTDERMTKWLVPHNSLQHTIETWLASNAKASSRRQALEANSSKKAQMSSACDLHPEPEPEPEPELEAVDPISLEPLAGLRYPAFNLPVDGENGSHPELYDARVLSNYLVSSGNFIHPTSRRPLQRSECQRMDTFIRKHRLGRPCVTASFDHSTDADTAGSRSGGGSGNLVEQHREEASDILLTLFGESAANESLRVVDHAQHVEEQASDSPLLLDDDFPTL